MLKVAIILELLFLMICFFVSTIRDLVSQNVMIMMVFMINMEFRVLMKWMMH